MKLRAVFIGLTLATIVGCDCGCGAADPDCAGLGCSAPSCQAEACDYCYDEEGNDSPCT